LRLQLRDHRHSPTDWLRAARAAEGSARLPDGWDETVLGDETLHGDETVLKGALQLLIKRYG